MKHFRFAAVGMGNGGEYAWFDPEREVEQAWGRHLPHWRQTGAIYFVTCRTVDSIPAQVLQQWERERQAWEKAHRDDADPEAEREYQRRFAKRMHRFLDDCHGRCPLKHANARSAVEEILRYADGESGSYALDAFAIMPNHLHVLVSPRGEADVSEIGKKWKRIIAHRVNKLLGLKGAFWQQESWDHLVRGPEHLEYFRRYTWDNPKNLTSEL